MRQSEIVPGIPLATVESVTVSRILACFPSLSGELDDLLQDVCAKILRLARAGVSRYDPIRSSPATYTQHVVDSIALDAFAKRRRDRYVQGQLAISGQQTCLSTATLGTDIPRPRQTLAEHIETEQVRSALDHANGCVTRAAAALGWTRWRLYRATTRNGITLSSFRAPPVKRRSTRRAAPAPATARRPGRKSGRRRSTRRSIPPAS